MKAFFRYKILLPWGIIMAVIPFGAPHLPEKIRMVMAGSLSKPLDMFDLFWHSFPLILLGIKIGMDIGERLRNSQAK